MILEVMRRIWRLWGRGRMTLSVSAAAIVAHKRFDDAVKNAERFEKLGEFSAALKSVDEALALRPDSVREILLASRYCRQLGDFVAALGYSTLAALHAPEDWGVVAEEVNSNIRLARLPEALQVIDSYLGRQPNCLGANYKKAQVLYSMGQHDHARQSLARCIFLNPHDAHSLNLMGLIEAREFGRVDVGEIYLRRALRCDPSNHQASCNLAWLLSDQDINEGLAGLDAILLRDPSDHEVRLMRAHGHLKTGRYSSGWLDYEARHRSVGARVFSRGVEPLSDSGDLRGKDVFVHCEQGLGDQIMFSSCIHDLVAEGANVSLECDARLAPIFERSFPAVRVIAVSGESATIEQSGTTKSRCVALGSLPARYRNDDAAFPHHSGYLIADGVRVQYWKERLAELGPEPKVGLSWRGGAKVTRCQLRSIPITDWRNILGKHAHFVSVQYGDVAEELARLHDASQLRVHHWPDELNAYSETAAVVCALDLVISVCTAMVHLAGSLGKPVWVLVPAHPEWRYQVRGTRIPWYPSARVFRQRAGEPWQKVINRLATAFDEHFLSKSVGMRG